LQGPSTVISGHYYISITWFTWHKAVKTQVVVGCGAETQINNQHSESAKIWQNVAANCQER